MKKKEKPRERQWNFRSQANRYHHRNPEGQSKQIKYDAASGRLKLSKVLPEGMVFPYDFGFVPSTQAEDGDPLDVLVLTDEPLFPGCEVRCKLIGVIEARQRDQGHTNRNDRLIATAEPSIHYADIRSLSDLNRKMLGQIDAFFVNYQKVRGIEFSVVGHGSSRKAYEILQKSIHH